MSYKNKWMSCYFAALDLLEYDFSHTPQGRKSCLSSGIPDFPLSWSSWAVSGKLLLFVECFLHKYYFISFYSHAIPWTGFLIKIINWHVYTISMSECIILMKNDFLYENWWNNWSNYAKRIWNCQFQFLYKDAARKKLIRI